MGMEMGTGGNRHIKVIPAHLWFQPKNTTFLCVRDVVFSTVTTAAAAAATAAVR